MKTQEEMIDAFVEIELKEPSDFLKIKETLTRIGIASKKEKKLTQTCHILHKRGKYYILHFKELFLLDGKESDISEDDLSRRNLIINLLEDWGLLKVTKPEKIEDPVSPLSHLKIIPFKNKGEWELVAKYSIGVRK